LSLSSQERLENAQLVTMEEWRKRTKLQVKDLYLKGIAKRGDMYNDGRSMGGIFRKSNPPMIFRRYYLESYYEYPYNAKYYIPGTGICIHPQRDLFELGITYPLWTVEAWEQYRYTVDLPVDYPDLGMSMMDLDDLIKCEHCGNFVLEYYTCEDCGKSICYGC